MGGMLSILPKYFVKLGYDKKINITSSPLICFASLFQSEGVFFIIKFWLSTLSNLKLMLKIA